MAGDGLKQLGTTWDGREQRETAGDGMGWYETAVYSWGGPSWLKTTGDGWGQLVTAVTFDRFPNQTVSNEDLKSRGSVRPPGARMGCKRLQMFFPPRL
jgi:hypothetical protein